MRLDGDCVEDEEPRTARRQVTAERPRHATEGEALFNLGYDDGFAGGAYSCGRCHTTGWSYDEKTADGNGALGPPLRGGVSLARFPGADPRPDQPDRLRLRRLASRASSTAATARAPAACRASAQPGRDRRPARHR